MSITSCQRLLMTTSMWLTFSFSWRCLLQSKTSLIVLKYSLSKESSPHSWYHLGSPTLFSRSFKILCFTRRSVVNTEFIFVRVVRFRSRFLLQMWMSSCSNSIFWRDHLCSIMLPLKLCQGSVDYLCESVIAGLSSRFHRSVSSVTNNTLSWLLWLYSNIWSQYHQTSTSISCWLSWAFCLST